ncbi:MAG TPA: hypothetical protein VM186_04040 [Planctomycetota bacterium]|nr:hypothetical protein [Planctomycetota bacterium]
MGQLGPKNPARMLITVKTYPIPSFTYLELVCTAGVLKDGSFVRLYPIDYRYRPYWEWYRKYEWVELDIEKNEKDPRPESYRPRTGALIRATGCVLSTEDNWAERKKFVLAKGVQTMCELRKGSQIQRSLGIVRPAAVKDFIAEPCERDWTAEQKEQFRQLSLFGPQRKPLEKIPYKFSYNFVCEESGCPSHQMMIEDWEAGQLFRKMRDMHGEAVAVQKVKQRFLDTICAPKVDTHFFVGTVLQHGTWIILGAFWPKRLHIAS